MDDIRQILGISFNDAELVVFWLVQKTFGKVMEEVLKTLDDVVYQKRDEKRYVVKDIREGKISTLVGDVEYRRRYYFDRQTGEYVYLLDEALGIGRGRVSPGLAILAAIQAVIGPSYRAARDSLERFFGYQIVSHETIRQLVLRIGEFLEEEEARVLEEPKGKRRVEVLFVEADGYRVSMQREKDREVRMAVSHEGWRPRNPGSDEYELVNKSYYVEAEHREEEFWEDASRHIYGIYEIDDKTMVVINGDRASWIRKGLEYFPKAIYQVDRYHLKRDLRDLLRDSPHLGKALAAADASDVGGMMESLREARLETADLSRAAEIDDLLSAMMEMPEAFIDYRVRLWEMGYDTRWMRGM